MSTQPLTLFGRITVLSALALAPAVPAMAQIMPQQNAPRQDMPRTLPETPPGMQHGATPPTAATDANPAPVPIRIEMSTVNGMANCGPRELRLPPGDIIQISVVNLSPTWLRFSAPAFLKGGKLLATNHPIIDPKTGSFMVGPTSTGQVVLRTPPPGSYGFSCNESGTNPTVESTGFLIVTPAS